MEYTSDLHRKTSHTKVHLTTDKYVWLIAVCMYGLVMERVRIEGVLSGSSPCDRRQFSTRKRERIALVDPAGKVEGFADLYDVAKITYATFMEFHRDRGPTADMWAQHRTYYEFRFRNVRRARHRFSVPVPDGAVLVDVPDGSENSASEQRSISDF